MTENMVQWVLLRRTDYLADALRLRLRRKIAEYQTTDYGIIDFAFDTPQDEIAVVELETEIRNTAKLEFCIEQSCRYKNLASLVPQPLQVFVLYDELGTTGAFAGKLADACHQNGLEARTYSMLKVQTLYQRCMEELEKTSGVYLGRPVAMNVTHLRLLNRFLQPFRQQNTDVLEAGQLLGAFTKGQSQTGFRVRRILAEHFDLLQSAESPKGQKRVALTDLGKSFCQNMGFEPLNKGHEFNLTHGQRQVLLQSLMNGRFTKSKVNIFYLLRFIHVTNGDWVPKSDRQVAPERVAYLNNFLGTTYRPDSLTRLVHFTLQQCVELGLAELIQTPRENAYLRAMLTSLGSRVLGFLELYLHLKREQMQIPIETPHLEGHLN